MGVIVVGRRRLDGDQRVKDQPKISKRAQNISSARWVLERLTREIRNGVSVESDKATASKVSFRTYVRHTACGGTDAGGSGTPAIECQVTYECTTTPAPGSRPRRRRLHGHRHDDLHRDQQRSVFSYSPSTEPSPLTCGPAVGRRDKYVGVKLHMPSADGKTFTVSDGAPCATRPCQLRWLCTTRSKRGRERGFTIIEVMVAAWCWRSRRSTTFGTAQRRDQKHPAGEVDPGGARPGPAGNRDDAQPRETKNSR